MVSGLCVLYWQFSSHVSNMLSCATQRGPMIRVTLDVTCHMLWQKIQEFDVSFI